MEKILRDENFGGGGTLSTPANSFGDLRWSKKLGFTLAEMMVVMLIMSIILAAMAPVMTTRNKSDYSSPWRYSPRNNSDAYFGAGDNQVALLGQSDADDAERDTKFLIRTAANSGFSHILFKTGESIVGRLYFDESNLFISNTNPSSNTGSNNTTIGVDAFMNNTSGQDNTVMGYNALTSNTTGGGNVAIGSNSLRNNRTGNDNIAIGTNSNYGNFTSPAAKTIAIGNQTSAYGNGSIAIGSSLISSEGDGTSYTGAYSSGSRSIAIGNGSSTQESDSIAIGTGAESGGVLLGVDTGISSIAIGNETSALGNNSVSIGSSSSGLGWNSVAIGNGTVSGTGSVGDTVAIGFEAISEEEDSIAIGNNAVVGDYGTSGIAIGTSASVLGSHGIAIGDGAKSVSSQYGGGYNIAIGSEAMGNASAGQYSIAIGAKALNKMNGTAGAAPNIGIGYQALMNLGTGADNLAVGFMALSDLVSGTSNTAIGSRACRYVTGTNKTCIGANSGPSSSDVNASNSDDVVYIGNANSTVYIKGNIVVDGHVLLGLNKSSYVYLRTARKGSNAVKNQSSKSVMALARSEDWHGDDDNFAKTYPNGLSSDGNAFFGDYLDEMKTVSDYRLKYVGQENTAGLDKIRQLKVFNYTFKKDEKKTPHVGVIAQDLQKVFPDAVKKGVDGFLTIRMEDMFYAVINAIKELDSKYQAQEKRINELEKRIEQLEAKIK